MFSVDNKYFSTILPKRVNRSCGSSKAPTPTGLIIFDSMGFLPLTQTVIKNRLQNCNYTAICGDFFFWDIRFPYLMSILFRQIKRLAESALIFCKREGITHLVVVVILARNIY